MQKQTTFLTDYQPTAYVLDTTSLDVVFAPGETIVHAKLRFELRKGSATGAPLKLHGERLILKDIRINGYEPGTEAYTVSDQLLIIHSPPQKFTLETTVQLAPEQNKSLEGLYRSGGVWCTQCEAEGFRHITYSLDRPDVMSVYTVRLEAAKKDAPVLLANGNLVQTGDLDGERHFAVWHDPHPKPSYLFAMVAGDLARVVDRFITCSGREVALAIYVEHGKQHQCAWAMDSLKRAMKWDEQKFNCEYDLDIYNIVAVSDFNLGAMENKGLNLFNDKFILTDPETATDQDYELVESIIAHEYFHNWTGNRITCRDWFQLCLKEGLTVFRDQEFTSDERSRAVKRIDDVRNLRIGQFPEDSGPLAHPPRPDRFTEINNFYTSTVYQKGAEIVRMILTCLGADFRKGMDIYLARHDGTAATIEQFIKCFEDASGRNLAHLQAWYTSAGRPDINIIHHYDAEGERLTLGIEQINRATPGQKTKHAKYIPMKFGLVSDKGEDLFWDRVTGATVEGDVMIIEKAKHEVVFEGVNSPPLLSLFRGFSAPVSITSDLTMQDKLDLIRLDDDPFVKWDSLQGVAISALGPAARIGGDPVALDHLASIAQAFRAILRDDRLDEAFKALALALPAHSVLADHIGENIDPERIDFTLQEAKSGIASMIEPELEATYRNMIDPAPYAPGARSAGKRSLKNQCLAWLIAANPQKGGERAGVQYREASNMTDRSAALDSLARSGHNLASALLADFRQKYCANLLVFDKWLRINAALPDCAALERVKSLMGDPLFNIENPNRVRALIQSFAENRVQFARKDGEGFKFVTGLIADIDRRTPQLAARLLTLFRSYKKYESIRREAAEKALQKLQDIPDLSSDCSDLLTRMLAE